MKIYNRIVLSFYTFISLFLPGLFLAFALMNFSSLPGSLFNLYSTPILFYLQFIILSLAAGFLISNISKLLFQLFNSIQRHFSEKDTFGRPFTYEEFFELNYHAQGIKERMLEKLGIDDLSMNSIIIEAHSILRREPGRYMLLKYKRLMQMFRSLTILSLAGFIVVLSLCDRFYWYGHSGIWLILLISLAVFFYIFIKKFTENRSHYLEFCCMVSYENIK